MTGRTCRTLALTLLALPTSADTARAGEPKPFRGVEHGVQEFGGFTEDGLFKITFTSEGIATYLHHYRGDGLVLIDLATGLPVHAEITLTAADGDQLFVELVGDPVDPFTTVITGTITGGTGRFEGATGGYTYLLRTDKPAGELPNPFVGIWFGEICFP